jgi:alanine racemase
MITDITRPSWIEIDTDALRHNIKTVKSNLTTGAKLMTVVKANAYGHGAVGISQVAQECGIDFLGVAMLEEAVELIDSEISTPIVILYPEDIDRSVEAVKRGSIITVSDLSTIDKIADKVESDALPIKYFIKVNTGMNRFGAKFENPNKMIEKIKDNPKAQFLGITTNLAFPNGNGSELAEIQKNKFEKISNTLNKISSNGYLLSSASSGSLSGDDIQNGSLFRVGHLIYGLHPNGGQKLDLKPVMSVKSRISEFQFLEKGEGVGYGFSYIAGRKMKVAVIPLGYADGYPWSLSNKGSVLIRGKKARVVGRVCMDAFMVDITDIDGCQIGDEVIIMGRVGDEQIDAHELGELAGSFSYEILSRWSKRVPRVYL